MIRSDLTKCANQNGMLVGVAYSTNDAMAVDLAYNGRVVVFDTETTGIGVYENAPELKIRQIENVFLEKMFAEV